MESFLMINCCLLSLLVVVSCQIPHSSDSCMGRCDDPLDNDFPCQCNQPCVDFGDCCEDYTIACPQPDEVTVEEMSNFVESLWALDVNRVDQQYYTTDKQGFIADTSLYIDVAPNRFFTSFDEDAIFSRPTFAAFLNVLDNYTPIARIDEIITDSKMREIELFLDEIFKTNVMLKTYNFLLSKGYVFNMVEFRSELKNMWFTLYSRTSDLDSSGFEHVFAGEFRTSAKVNGFHNWLQLYLLEKDGALDYYGHMTEDQPSNVLEMQLTWEGNMKELTSVVLGASPEFEMAMFTTCFLIAPDTVCQFNLGGSDIGIQTYDMNREYIGTAYWVIS